MRKQWVAMLLVLLLAGVAAAPVRAETPIRPGGCLRYRGTCCTLNFVFADPAGELYIAASGLCAGPVNARVSNEDGEFGRVAFSEVKTNDDRFAFIRVDPAKRRLVDPRVLGHDGPTGLLGEQGARRGDVLHIYGQGLGPESAPIQARRGVLHRVFGDGGFSSYTPVVMRPDSGSPVLHQSGAAFGLMTAMSGDPQHFAIGMTVARALDIAAEAGLKLRLVTV